MGETGSFFGRTQMTGFHQESVRRVAAGAIDASAVDSQALGTLGHQLTNSSCLLDLRPG